MILSILSKDKTFVYKCLKLSYLSQTGEYTLKTY